MSVFLAAFFASYLFIALKALQQLQVVHGEYLRILPTSLAMAACEVFVISNVAATGWGWIVWPVGLGSGLGCMTAMWLHGKWRKR